MDLQSCPARLKNLAQALSFSLTQSLPHDHNSKKVFRPSPNNH
jgi:hypothetical protein